jgi:hypothetical protein
VTQAGVATTTRPTSSDGKSRSTAYRLSPAPERRSRWTAATTRSLVWRRPITAGPREFYRNLLVLTGGGEHRGPGNLPQCSIATADRSRPGGWRFVNRGTFRRRLGSGWPKHRRLRYTRHRRWRHRWQRRLRQRRRHIRNAQCGATNAFVVASGDSPIRPRRPPVEPAAPASRPDHPGACRPSLVKRWRPMNAGGRRRVTPKVGC